MHTESRNFNELDHANQVRLIVHGPTIRFENRSQARSIHRCEKLQDFVIHNADHGNFALILPAAKLLDEGIVESLADFIAAEEHRDSDQLAASFSRWAFYLAL